MSKKKKGNYRPLSRQEALAIFTAHVAPTPASQHTTACRPLYLGYGSNLHMEQMQARCPDSKPFLAVKLEGWQLEFSGVLTIERHKGSHVEAALYECSAADERALDRYEGYPRMYDKVWTKMLVGGKERSVFFYTLNQPYNITAPGAYYERVCRKGFENWQLDMAMYDEALGRAAHADRFYADFVGKEVEDVENDLLTWEEACELEAMIAQDD